MNDLTLRKQLQAWLLDRLTGDEPGNLQEGTDRRVLSVSQLKALFMRDLIKLQGQYLDRETALHYNTFRF